MLAVGVCVRCSTRSQLFSSAKSCLFANNRQPRGEPVDYGECRFTTASHLKHHLRLNSITHNALKKNQLSGRSGTDYFFPRLTSINRLCVYCRLVRALCVCHSLKSKCPGDVTAKVVLFKHKKGQTDFFFVKLSEDTSFFHLTFCFPSAEGQQKRKPHLLGGEETARTR